MSQVPEIESFKNKLLLERGKLLDAIRSFAWDELQAPLPGGWSVKDILAHIANSEHLNVRFAQWMLATDNPVQLQALAGDYPDYVAQHAAFDLDTFNAYTTARLRAKSLAEVLETLDATRAATLAWMDTLAPEQLDREGQHAVWGAQTVRGILKILIIHDKMHRQEIVNRVSPNE